MSNPISIHPRSSVYGRHGVKKNTAEPYKRQGKGKLGRAMKSLNRRRLAHSTLIRSLTSGQNPAAYRTPGSMKGA